MKQLAGIVLVFVFVFLPVGLKGQDYRFELGLGGGVSSYMGEANTEKPLLNPNASISLLGRWNLSGNTALRANLAYAGVSGSTLGNASDFMLGSDIQFDNGLIEANMLFELGFAQYGVPVYHPGFRKWSPYVAVGLGLTGYKADKNRVCLNIPFGVGVKYKVLPRLNVGLEWMFRKTFTDNLDYSSESAGFQLNDVWTGAINWNKNKDWYSIPMLYVTLDLWGTGPDCFR